MGIVVRSLGSRALCYSKPTTKNASDERGLTGLLEQGHINLLRHDHLLGHQEFADFLV